MMFITWLRWHLSHSSTVNLPFFPFPTLVFGNYSQNLAHSAEQKEWSFSSFSEHYHHVLLNSSVRNIFLFPYLFLYSIIHFSQYGLMYTLWIIINTASFCRSRCSSSSHWELFQVGSCVSLRCPLWLFENFLTFWYLTVLRTHPAFSLPCLRNS